MIRSGSPTARRELGRRLRKERERAGLTIRSVREAGLFSESKIARIEAGKVPVRTGDVWMLCSFYKTSPQVTDELADLTADFSNDGGWDAQAVVTPGWRRLYRGLEETCAVLSAYHPELIHGVLQTESYARAVIQADGHSDEEAVAAHLKIQMEHSRLVLERPNRSLRIVLGSGALSMRFGSPEVMSEQVAHLCTLNSSDGIDLRVLPRSVGAHPGISGPFTLMDFDDADDPSVVCLETLLGARHLERDEEVYAYRQFFDLLYRQATPIADSCC